MSATHYIFDSFIIIHPFSFIQTVHRLPKYVKVLTNLIDLTTTYSCHRDKIDRIKEMLVKKNVCARKKVQSTNRRRLTSS